MHRLNYEKQKSSNRLFPHSSAPFPSVVKVFSGEFKMEQRWPWAQKQFEGCGISNIRPNYFFRTKEQLHTRSQKHPRTDSGKSRVAIVTDFVVVEFVEELAFFLRLGRH